MTTHVRKPVFVDMVTHCQGGYRPSRKRLFQHCHNLSRRPPTQLVKINGLSHCHKTWAMPKNSTIFTHLKCSHLTSHVQMQHYARLFFNTVTSGKHSRQLCNFKLLFKLTEMLSKLSICILDLYFVLGN